MEAIGIIIAIAGVYLMAMPLWNKFFIWLTTLSFEGETEYTPGGLDYQ